jgi:hypothetical protein
MAEGQTQRRHLTRDISDYRVVPYRVAEAVLRQPRWRVHLDDLLVRFAGSTQYGQAVRTRRGRLASFLGIFEQIGSGELERAHQSLVAVDGRPS